MTLSTARPHLGAGPPELHPVFLKRRKPVRVGEGRLSKTNMVESLKLSPGTVKDASELHVRGGRSEEVEVPFTQAGTERSGFSANFRVGTPVSLSSGSRRRVLVKRAELPVEVSLYSAPRLSPHVFATGSLTNTMDIPILKGMGGVTSRPPAPPMLPRHRSSWVKIF